MSTDGFFDVWRCSYCGESQIDSSSSRWRWTGNAWEHLHGAGQEGVYQPAHNCGPQEPKA